MEKLFGLTSPALLSVLLCLNLAFCFSTQTSAQAGKELLEKRTLNSKTFDNGDGTFTLVAHRGHIHYADEATGQLRDCDTTLVDMGDKWVQTQASYHCEVPKYADGPFIFIDVFEGKNQKMVMRPLAEHIHGEMDDSDGLINKRVIYRDAYGQGLHLRVTAGNEGLTKEIIIDEMPSPLTDLSFDFQILLSSKEDVYVQDDEHQGGVSKVSLDSYTFTGNQQLLIGGGPRAQGDFSRIRKIRAWDSDGETIDGQIQFYRKGTALYFRKTVLSEFLSDAAYPVFTDDTVTYDSGTGDGWVQKRDNTNWDTTHNAVAGSDVDYASATTFFCRTGVRTTANRYIITRGFFPFNTAALPDSATITAASLDFYITATENGNNDGDDFVVVVQTTQPSTSSLSTADYDLCGSVHNPVEGSGRYDITSIPTGAYYSLVLNSTGRGWISTTGWTKLGVREGHDVVDSAYTGAQDSKNRINGNHADNGSLAPRLSITYTANQAPTLNWTGNPGFESDGIDPDSGLGGTTFEFQVEYTDADNDAPSVSQVWIDLDDSGTYEAGEKFDMAGMGGSDYTVGVNYNYSRQIYYDGDGTLNYVFYFKDGIEDAIGTPASDQTFTVTNNVPTLDWTGNTGFVSDGIDPDSGLGGTTFEFQVEYTDADNNAPSVKEVWIDLDDSSSYEPGEKFDMSSMGGSDYTAGVNYTTSRQIYYTGDGTLTYQFQFSDGTDAATGMPASDHTFTVTNSPPTLDWTGETGFESDGVDPDSAGSGTTFEFQVEYTDVDNSAPTVREVWIDLDDSSSYEPGEMFAMSEVNPGDTNYQDGKDYTYSRQLFYAGDGTLNYKFHFRDGIDDATGTPITDHTFTVTNNVPTLDWTGETGFELDGVDPDSGLGGTTFDFQVEYTDADNDPPTVQQVWIDLDDSGTYEPGEKFDMSGVDAGDTNYQDGKDYTYSRQVFYAGDGTLNYRFSFNDGRDEATGTPTSDHAFIVNTPPQLDWTGNSGFESDGVNPDSGPGGTTFEFQVEYTDADNDPPAVKEVWIDLDDSSSYEPGEKFDMSGVNPGDTNYQDGKDYTYSRQIYYAGDGTLNYRFYFSDGTDEATGTPAGDQTVTVTNNVPSLDWTGNAGFESDGVDPDSAGSGSTFEFQVEYTDIDNNAPSVKQVWIDLDDSGTYEVGEQFDMAGMGGSDYTAGVDYNYSTPIDYAGDGTLKYTFYFNDGADDATGTPATDQNLTVLPVGADLAVCPTCPYTTIQSAIDDASCGDRVVVGTPGRTSPETYVENIFMKNCVDVVSEPAGGAATTTYNDPWGTHSTTVLERAALTIIDGGANFGSVVIFDETIDTSTRLDGFTVQNIDSVLYDYPLVGVTGGGTNSRVINCIIRNNQGGGQSPGIGTRGRWESPLQEFDTAPTFENNVIHNVHGPGIGCGPNSHAIIRNNEIWDCRNDSPGIGLQGDTYPTITGNTIFDCQAGIGSRGPADEGLLEAMGGTLTIPAIGGNEIYNNAMAGIRLKRKPDDTGTVNITIGESGQANTIYGNGTAGIRVDGATSTTDDPTNVTIRYNSIYGNAGGSGIDLDYLTTAIIQGNDINNNHWAGISMWEGLLGATIDNNIISENGSAGVSISYETAPAADQTVVIQNNNQIYGNGMAGIRNDSATSVTITGNDIYGNSMGGIRMDTGSGTIGANDIYQNATAGIAMRDACDGCLLEISNNDIYENVRGAIHTGTDEAGGGFLGTAGSFTLTIKQNKVHSNGQSGYGGGIDVRHAAGTIYNNLVYKNHRGGIRFWDYVTEVVNNTVVYNGYDGNGGGIIFDDPAGAVNAPADGVPSVPILIRDNIAAYNETTGIRACFVNTDLLEERDYNLVYANNGTGETDCGWPDNLKMSCVNKQFGGCGGKWNIPGGPPWIIMDGANNRVSDPKFVDKDSDNYQLQADSPAIDAGDPDEAYNDQSFPPSQGEAINDMGAYGGPDALDW